MPPTPDPRLGQRIIAASRLAAWEARIERAVRRALDVHRAHALASLRHMGSRPALTAASVVPDPFGADTWGQAVDDEVAPEVASVLGEVADLTAHRFLRDASTLGRIDLTGRMGRLLGLVHDLGPETATSLERTLTLGVNAGEGVDKLSARVRDVFDVSERRATRIARTEVVGAANGASHDAAMVVHESGMLLTKTWLAELDDATRPDHEDADGQTVPADQPFDVGGEELMYPGDEGGSADQVVNCRCSVTYSAADGGEGGGDGN